MDKLRQVLNRIERETLEDRLKFRDLYQFTFKYAKSAQQSSMVLELAIRCWEIRK
jgi:hypothetical protein